jgi:hypothetical protein
MIAGKVSPGISLTGTIYLGLSPPVPKGGLTILMSITTPNWTRPRHYHFGLTCWANPNAAPLGHCNLQPVWVAPLLLGQKGNAGCNPIVGCNGNQTIKTICGPCGSKRSNRGWCNGPQAMGRAGCIGYEATCRDGLKGSKFIFKFKFSFIIKSSQMPLV